MDDDNTDPGSGYVFHSYPDKRPEVARQVGRDWGWVPIIVVCLGYGILVGGIFYAAFHLIKSL